MKRCASLLLAALAACASAPRPRPVLAPQPRVLLDSQCFAEDDNDITIDASNDAYEEAPVLLLTEDQVGYGNGPLVTLAMWADGTVVYGDGWVDDESVRQARVTPAEVERLRTQVLATLAEAPLYQRLGRMDPVTNQQLSWGAHDQATWILVRHGDRWRVAYTWGLQRKDVVPAPPEPPPPPEPPAAPEPPAPDPGPRPGEVVLPEEEAKVTWIGPDHGATIEIDNADELAAISARSVEEMGHPAFIDAYRTLLRARPSGGEPLVPYTYDVKAFIIDEAHPPVGWKLDRWIPWPDDLPVPPQPLPGHTCEPTDDGNGGCYFRLDPAHAPAARHFTGQRPYPRLRFLDRIWVVNVTPYLRGDDTLARVRDCANSAWTHPNIYSH